MADFELRDPIHRRISFSEEERTVIDHPFLQRLRFISQLGFVQSSVYPGALHNRFTHVLGAMHVAGRLFGRFVSAYEPLQTMLTDEQRTALRLRVRLGGLMHDIGHGPLSHASERIFPQLSTLPMDWSWWKEQPQRQATHEDYSVLLLQTMVKEGSLDADLAQDVASLVHGTISPSKTFHRLCEGIDGLPKALKFIISGEIDCDRMDYLLRDSYYCGVEYGSYDLDWLISSLCLIRVEDALVLGLSENGVRAFEDFLLSRYHMIDQVYFHKTKAGFVHYLEQAFLEKEIDLTIPSDPYAYADLRDSRVIEQLFEASKDKSHYWSSHLVGRIPAHRVMRFQGSKPEDQTLLDRLQTVCTQASVRFFTHSAAKTLTDLGEQNPAGQRIFVQKKTLKGMVSVPVFEYSDLLNQYNEKLQITDFFVLREDVSAFQRLIKKMDF